MIALYIIKVIKNIGLKDKTKQSVYFIFKKVCYSSNFYLGGYFFHEDLIYNQASIF